MADFHQPRLVLGAALIVVGGGTLVLWSVERRAWLWLLLLIGAAFVGLGAFLLSYRRHIASHRAGAVTERHSIFGLDVGVRHWHGMDFLAVGNLVSRAELVYLDVVLFRRDGGFLILRTMLGDAEAAREIARVAWHLGLPAEGRPRTRAFVVG